MIEQAPDPQQGDATVAETATGGGGWRALRDILETLLLTVLIFVSVRAVVQSFQVEGESMMPSLETRELLLVNKAAYWRLDWLPPASASNEATAPASSGHFLFGPPQRGEVIVFEAPEDRDKDYIKRVIGVSGDVVVIREGAVYLNGRLLNEPYLSSETVTHLNGIDQKNRWKVPEGSLFVLGDNRFNSLDSRDWGYLPVENVVGRAVWAYWPLDKWGGLPNAVASEGR